MGDLVFYTNPQSRGRIVRWMLEEVGADYETVVLDYQRGMKGDEYRAINPMTKVPSIVHKGRTVTECAAICAYLADVFPEAGMAPPVDQRADYYRWLFFTAGPLEQAVTSHAVGWNPAEEQQRMFGFGCYEKTIDTLESAVGGLGDRWLTGERFSAADLYVGAHLSWGTMFGTIPKRDAFMAFLGRAVSRPAAIRANEIDDVLANEPA